MTRKKVKKKEILDMFKFEQKTNKRPCRFQELEKHLDFLIKVDQECKNFEINQYGKDKRCVWILYGKHGDEYFALQVGEVAIERAAKEILSDISAMYSGEEYSLSSVSDEDELTIIDTEFYKNTYAVKNVKDKRIYAYKKIRNEFEELLFYQLKIDDYLGLNSDGDTKGEFGKVRNELVEIAKSYYAESKLAYETQAQYWNPYYSGVGYEILKLLKQYELDTNII